MEEEKSGKSLDYDFETVHNIDIYGCELAPMTKQGLRSWNMTVQYWLASFVHKRVPASLKAHRLEVIFWLFCATRDRHTWKVRIAKARAHET